ncbi:MAG: HIT family protein [Candidatus Pacebacteria bacterium]|jgi:diadenosine tetraphosphate (Ap4A) HIT family hydrolase|nr:HIT family protein [Candidatus Paceibacterota bacterium]MBT4651894.1 HIT family protein [Candidatus Paceibacterota bacterium]MBT6755714.1 HIT family protein [Candidatus Paceibacterota bacterium]MBT6921220.1 HIT family protein [Candidatus Paceibacterota bacterium]
MDKCIFCEIVKKNIPSHTIWEDEKHLAFLSIFPNTKGFTVVIPKEHHDSYAFEQSDEVLQDLIIATKKVANILDSFFDDTTRCGMFFEGFGVDHLHSKLSPMHGPGDLENWQPLESKAIRTYFEKYPGYLSSNDSERADDEELGELAKEIRNSN